MDLPRDVVCWKRKGKEDGRRVLTNAYVNRNNTVKKASMICDVRVERWGVRFNRGSDGALILS